MAEFPWQQLLVHLNFLQDLSSCPFTMADHNASPMAHVKPNPDPALNPALEHTHEHIHHSARAVHEESSHVAYTTGTTDEKTSKLLNENAHSSHVPHHNHAEHDIEKTGGIAAYDDKGTRRSSSDPELERETQQKPWYSPSMLYRRFRLPVHIFFMALITG